MGTDNFAYGNFMAPGLPLADGAIQTPYATILPPTTRVAAFVRSGGIQDGDSEFIRNNLVTTLDAGLKRCRSGLGDYVYVLPDHSENVSSADQMSSLVAGTRIVGLGAGTLRPTLTWTAAAATFLFDVANVSLSNFVLKFATSDNGGVTVAAPITVSAAGCSITGCDIRFGDDANDIVTIGVTTTAAADDFTFSNNHCVAATAAECTTFMNIIGCDRLRMHDNYIAGATSNVAVGIVRFATTASLNVDLRRNFYANRKALSTCAVTGLAACSGVSHDEHFHYLDTSSLTPWLTSTGIMSFHRPTVTNTAGETGTETVGTVSA